MAIIRSRVQRASPPPEHVRRFRVIDDNDGQQPVRAKFLFYLGSNHEDLIEGKAFDLYDPGHQYDLSVGAQGYCTRASDGSRWEALGPEPCRCPSCEWHFDYFPVDGAPDPAIYDVTGDPVIVDGALEFTAAGSVIVKAPHPDGVPTARLYANIVAQPGAIVVLAVGLKGTTYVGLRVLFGDPTNDSILAVDQDGTRLDEPHDPPLTNQLTAAYDVCISPFHGGRYAISAGQGAVIDLDADAAQVGIFVIATGGEPVRIRQIRAVTVTEACDDCIVCPNCGACQLCGGFYVGTTPLAEYRTIPGNEEAYPGIEDAFSYPTGLELRPSIIVRGYHVDDTTYTTPLVEQSFALGAAPFEYDPDNCQMLIDDDIGNGEPVGTVTIPLSQEGVEGTDGTFDLEVGDEIVVNATLFVPVGAGPFFPILWNKRKIVANVGTNLWITNDGGLGLYGPGFIAAVGGGWGTPPGSGDTRTLTATAVPGQPGLSTFDCSAMFTSPLSLDTGIENCEVREPDGFGGILRARVQVETRWELRQA